MVGSCDKYDEEEKCTQGSGVEGRVKEANLKA
jgi:hypothetical protein